MEATTNQQKGALCTSVYGTFWMSVLFLGCAREETERKEKIMCKSLYFK